MLIMYSSILNFYLNVYLKGWRASIVVWTFVLHAADQGSISGIPFEPVFQLD